jgi:hypothetical protein
MAKESDPDQVTSVIWQRGMITFESHTFPHNAVGGISFVLRLDYVSCGLTIASTILVGRRSWEGWALAALNSVIVCVIGLRTDQLGFIPANVFCMVMSGMNLRAWRKSGSHPQSLVR